METDTLLIILLGVTWIIISILLRTQIKNKK